MSTQLYYTEPPIEQFNELKVECIKFWKFTENQDFYTEKKVVQLKYLKNISNNFISMITDIMFEKNKNNLSKLAKNLSMGTRKAIRIRMIDGGMLSDNIIF